MINELQTRIFSYRFRHETIGLRLITLGIFVHTVLFAGVMDIYFSSPVQHGLPSYKANVSLSKRVVVFVSDGLRAEGIFSNSKYTPYLTNLRTEVGAWGVAHTRVPTESRPGHVAIFAGMYEDPNAITRGWKYNPIDFDHVFNQSKASYLWGSPDVVPMFNKDHVEKIHTEYYEPSFEDFSGQQSTILLDEWVFDKVKKYFQLNHPNLSKDKSIFFLHLLGMDTAGHVYKPNSKKYFDNLKFVDEGIQTSVKMMDNYFEDNETTYIFTSDHGMTNWGSHGSGSHHETETPFIIWGANVKQNPQKQDLDQADITPIISCLLGINIPINSVGIFQEKFFDISKKKLANILFTNALVITEQYKVLQYKMKRNFISFFYEDFEGLRDLDNIIDSIKKMIGSGDYTDAILKIKSVIPLLEQGKYHNTQYLRVPMLICLSLGLGIFMIQTAAIAVGVPDDFHRRFKVTESNLMNMCYRILSVTIGIVVFLWYKNVEVKYCLYIAFPLITILYLAYDADQLSYLIKLICEVKLKHLTVYALVFAGIQCLTLTFFHREYIFYVTMGILVWMFKGNLAHLTLLDKLIWLSISLYLPTFYSLSPTFTENNHVVSTIGAVMVMYIGLMIIVGSISELNVIDREIDFLHLLVVVVQNLCLFLSALNIVLISYFNETSSTVMNYIYVSSWTILVICLITMTLHPRDIIFRAVGIQVSLFNIYYLMSFNGEGLFLALFICLCLTWGYTELQKMELLDTPTFSTFGDPDNFLNNTITTDDFRRCFIFMSFTLMSFFGAGNISDMNTFDPMWTRCFVKVFNPFLMSALIGLKLVIPFFITTVTFQSINVSGGIPMLSSFAIILFYSDIMVFNMMFLVTNQGSWLEIGLSISRFLITNVITIALLIIYMVTQHLTENRLYDILRPHFPRPRRRENPGNNLFNVMGDRRN